MSRNRSFGGLWLRGPVLAAALLVVTMPRAAAQAAPDGVCLPDAGTVTWMQRALSGWARVRRALRLDDADLPWMVFYDTRCAWHVGFDATLPGNAMPVDTMLVADAAALAVRARPHADHVWLPNGAEIPSSRLVAFASLYHEERAAFFVVATPAMWRTDPEFGADPNLEDFFLGVTMHELAHTRHLPLVIRRVRMVADRAGLKDLHIDDDVIQNTFSVRPGFREAFEAERDILFEAATAGDTVTRRSLLRRGLALARTRRAKFYVGDQQHYQAFEDIFLAMEGVGQWAAYRFALAGPPARTPAEAIAFVRDHKYWSQEEGLALFLLLDLEVPGWQTHVFSVTDPGPFALLEKAVAAGQYP